MSEQQKVSRREFVANCSGLLFSLQPFLFDVCQRPALSGNSKIIVLIHLAGGNDWFNTIIPYPDPAYYQARPSIAISTKEVLPLDNTFAFHPSMSGIKTLYDQHKVSILLNIGHDQPTLSHHKAIGILQTDWLDHYTKLANQDNSLIFPAINVEPTLPAKEQIIVSSLSPDNGFVFDLDIHYRVPRCSIRAVGAGVELQAAAFSSPLHNIFADGLNRIADMIKENSNTTMYNISLGGFDTHENQFDQHAFLLHMLSEAIFSFQQNLNQHGLTDRVLTVIQSEFGRSLKENNDSGTDHGLTNHALVIGNSIKSGIYGNYSSPMEFVTDRYLFL